MLTQPGASSAVGFSETTNPRTAKARFPSSQPKRWQAQPVQAKRQCPGDETVQIFFNDTPLLRKIAYDENANSFTAEYQLQENTSTDLWPEDGTGFLHFNQGYSMTGPTGYAPHGTYLIASEGSESQRQVWIDTTVGSTATVTFTCNVAPTSASDQGGIQVYRYNSGEEGFTDLPDDGWIPFVATTTSYTFSPTISDDYSFAIIGAEKAVLVGGFQVQFSTTTGIWCHLPMEGLLEDEYRYGRGKVTNLAHDILVKNGASELNDQGWISVARLQDTTDWWSLITNGVDGSIFANVSNYGDDTVRWLDTFKRGLHTWMVPGQEGWQKLSKWAELDPVQMAQFDLTYRRDYNWWPPLIIAISSINPPGATVITGCDALFVENQWFEFTSSNKHESCELSWVSPLEWMQALWYISFDGIAREFTDNPDPEAHWQAPTGEMHLMLKNSGIGQHDNPGHIARFFSRVFNVLNPLAEAGIKFGRKLIEPYVGSELAGVGENVARNLLEELRGARRGEARTAR